VMWIVVPPVPGHVYPDTFSVMNATT